MWAHRVRVRIVCVHIPFYILKYRLVAYGFSAIRLFYMAREGSTTTRLCCFHRLQGVRGCILTFSMSILPGFRHQLCRMQRRLISLMFPTSLSSLKNRTFPPALSLRHLTCTPQLLPVLSFQRDLCLLCLYQQLHFYHLYHTPPLLRLSFLPRFLHLPQLPFF